MEDKKMNEKESLELIAQMIQNTRRNLDAGSGNMFLLWGYVSVVVTLVVWVGIYFTKNDAWMWGFWGIPVIGYLLMFILLRKRYNKPVKSYSDKVLNEIWQVLGILCMAVAIGASINNAYEIIIPLCTIFMSLGSIFTGCVVRYTAFSGFPSMGAMFGLGMMFDVLDKSASLSMLLTFVVALFLSMIIPGHILNYKARKEAAKGK